MADVDTIYECPRCGNKVVGSGCGAIRKVCFCFGSETLMQPRRSVESDEATASSETKNHQS